MKVEIKKLGCDVSIPAYARDGDACFDLSASESVAIWPGQSKIVGTDLAVHIGNPEFVLKIYSRSGLASKGVFVGNGVGIVDSGYQGELKVLLVNGSDNVFIAKKGDRIAQAMVQRVERVEFVEVDDFSYSSERGEGGFGSTGIS